MRQAAILLILCFVCFSLSCSNSGSGNGDGFTYGPGDYDRILSHDGLDRRYILHVPELYNKTPVPMVIIIHGGGGDAESAVKYFELNEKADAEDFIAVYPEGTGEVMFGKLIGTWNGGECCGYAQVNDIDDVGFIRSMMDEIKGDFSIDADRIYVTGMSNGAIMAYRLACEMSNEIAAIAAHSSIGHYSSCAPSRSVPTLHIHGKLDPCASYDGCTACESCFLNFLNEYSELCLLTPLTLTPEDTTVMSVEAFMEEWRLINGCTPVKTTTWTAPLGRCETYADCGGGEVVLCSIDDMGHTWAGRDNYSPDACDTAPDGCVCTAWKNAVGDLSQALDANDVIWEFFEKHAL